MIEEANFEFDKLNGTWKCWYENGQLKEEGFYSSNKKMQRWKYWHENGMLKEEGLYHLNRKSGCWKSWNANGELESEWCYDGGTKLSKSEYKKRIKKYQNMSLIPIQIGDLIW